MPYGAWAQGRLFGSARRTSHACARLPTAAGASGRSAGKPAASDGAAVLRLHQERARAAQWLETPRRRSECVLLTQCIRTLKVLSWLKWGRKTNSYSFSDSARPGPPSGTLSLSMLLLWPPVLRAWEPRLGDVLAALKGRYFSLPPGLKVTVSAGPQSAQARLRVQPDRPRAACGH